MAVFRVERTRDYTVMSNFHLRDKQLSLKAKGLLSQMLSLPDNWDYTLAGLSKINRESKDAIRSAVNELESAGYIVRHQKTDTTGKFSSNEYVIYEHPLAPLSENPTTDNPPSDDLSSEKAENVDSPTPNSDADKPLLDNPLSKKPSSGKPLSENPTTGNPSTEKPTSDNPSSGNPLSENPTQLNTKKQNTDLQRKDLSNTDSFHSYNSPVSQNRSEAMPVDVMESWREVIWENVQYEVLQSQLADDSELIDEIIELMLEIICCRRDMTRVGKTDYPHEIVRSRFLKLTDEHIRFVIRCLKENTTKIINPRQYLLTMLFNAPATINSYYTNRISHDFHANVREE